MSVTIWNRLEARPRSLNIERALRAEIRDPLWMLSRQWQFGEFLGTDAGSAILTRVKYRNAPLQAVSPGNAAPIAYTGEYPLEAAVEKLPVQPDLMMRVEMGRHWLRLLKKELPATKTSSITAAFRADERWHFHLPAGGDTEAQIDQAQILGNRELARMIRSMGKGRMLDGGALYFYLKQNPNHKASDFLQAAEPAVDELGKQFVEWFERVYGADTIENPAWQASRLEYQSTVQLANAGEGKRVLSADEHSGGRLDWYQFDYAEGNEEGDANPAEQKEHWQSKVFIPSAASYPGMPAARYWEMEGQGINFGDIQTANTDTAKLIFAQFGLLYGNDWMNIPLELPLGQLCKVSELEVVDVFGQRVRIPHVHHRGQNEFWGFFQLHDRDFGSGKQNDGSLWLPPVVSRAQASGPLEKVVFIRDEMANMVWAIENTIPDGLGKGMDGFEQAQRVEAYIRSLLPEIQQAGTAENEAIWKYRLASEVADNWIPFIPMKMEGSVREIQLQRAAMPRIIPGQATRRIRPQTSILRAEGFQAPYYLFEEEILRAGAVVSQQWNRCRWHNGGVVVWLSRTKTNGRGEQSSGLRYDFLEEARRGLL